MRSDIFETLKFNDKNKIYQDSSVEIKWTAEKLDDMFFYRIRKHSKGKNKISDELKCNAIFNVKLVRHSISPFRHILRRTFYRPRDIIVYFNKLRISHDKTRSSLFTPSDLYNAQNEFSISMYNELMDEWGIQKPEVKDYLAVIQNIGTQIFTYSEYQEHFFSILGISDKAKVNESLIFLFQNSIIGQKRSINWEYICTNNYLQIDFTKRFHVNYGLIDRLTLVEKRDK